MTRSPWKIVAMLKTMWKKYGDSGYEHILRTVRDMALEHGIDSKIYDKILTENI